MKKPSIPLVVLSLLFIIWFNGIYLLNSGSPLWVVLLIAGGSVLEIITILALLSLWETN